MVAKDSEILDDLFLESQLMVVQEERQATFERVVKEGTAESVPW